MVQFSKCKKGYKPEEVDSYIEKLIAGRDNVLLEQKEKFNLMNNEYNKLKKELQNIKQKEDSINKAIITANEKAKEIEAILIKRIRLESDRLRLFQLKWNNYCSETIASMKLDKRHYSVDSYLNTAREELALVLHRHFKLPKEKANEGINAHFRDENERLTRKAYSFDWADATIDDEDISGATDALSADNNNFDEYFDFGFKTNETLENLCKEIL